MKTKNVQTVLKIREYERFKEVLKQEKMPLKEGIKEADEGKFATERQVNKTFKKWGVNAG